MIGYPCCGSLITDQHKADCPKHGVLGRATADFNRIFDAKVDRALKVAEAIGEKTGQGTIPCDCGGTISWTLRGSRSMRAACNSCEFEMMA